MNSKKIMSALIVVLAVVGIFLGLWIFGNLKNKPMKGLSVVEKEAGSAAKKEEPAKKETGLPATTGKIEDITNGISDQMLLEEKNFSDEDGESSSIAADSAALNDFGQSYDENEF